MTRTVEQEDYDHETQRIRVGVSKILKKRGLTPRFKRWRLAKDPDTGMVIFFGVLNIGYIAAHTSIPFRDYFDPALLLDLANQARGILARILFDLLQENCLGIVGGIGVFLFMKAVRESPFYLQKKLDAVWIRAAQSLARHRGKTR